MDQHPVSASDTSIGPLAPFVLDWQIKRRMRRMSANPSSPVSPAQGGMATQTA